VNNMELLSVGGPDECMSLSCRREYQYETDTLGVCRGWHCANCGVPSSMYGHKKLGGWSCNPDQGGGANVDG